MPHQRKTCPQARRGSSARRKATATGFPTRRRTQDHSAPRRCWSPPKGEQLHPDDRCVAFLDGLRSPEGNPHPTPASGLDPHPPPADIPAPPQIHVSDVGARQERGSSRAGQPSAPHTGGETEAQRAANLRAATLPSDALLMEGRRRRREQKQQQKHAQPHRDTAATSARPRRAHRGLPPPGGGGGGGGGLSSAGEEYLRRCVAEKQLLIALAARRVGEEEGEGCGGVACLPGPARPAPPAQPRRGGGGRSRSAAQLLPEFRGVAPRGAPSPLRGVSSLLRCCNTVLRCLEAKEAAGLTLPFEILSNSASSPASPSPSPPPGGISCLRDACASAASSFGGVFPHLCAGQIFTTVLLHTGGKWRGRGSATATASGFLDGIDASLRGGGGAGVGRGCSSMLMMPGAAAASADAPEAIPLPILRWAFSYASLVSAGAWKRVDAADSVSTPSIAGVALGSLGPERVLEWLEVPAGECVFWSIPVEAVVALHAASPLAEYHQLLSLLRPEGICFLLEGVEPGIPNAQFYRGGGGGGGGAGEPRFSTVVLPPLLRFSVTDVSVRGMGVVVTCRACRGGRRVKKGCRLQELDARDPVAEAFGRIVQKGVRESAAMLA